MKLFSTEQLDSLHTYKNDIYCPLSAKEYIVECCELSKVESFIEYWHYSKNVNGLTYDYCFLLKNKDNIVVGGMIYGKISMAGVWKKYSDREDDLIELKRLACIDITPKNTESYFIGWTLRWLKKNTKIKTVISYADETFGHSGIIYKASNFQYIGQTDSDGKVIMYNNKRYHDKTIRTKYNGRLKPFALKIISALTTGKAEYVPTKKKNIYIYNLRK